ncbi:GPI ethanolamine phosphate transferase 1, partial [Suillus ampliporus]
LVWIEVEATVQSNRAGPTSLNQGYKFHTDDIRIALFFLFFVQVAFFGTGNVASISSFYLEPVYCLVPIFNPFFMAALLIFKIVAPYMILSAVFATLNAKLHLLPFSLFLVALMLTDG